MDIYTHRRSDTLPIDLTGYDPLQAITQNDPNGLAVYAAHIQVQNIVVQTTILIGGISANSQTDIGDRIISSLANQIQSGTVDLTNPAQLQTIIQSAATQLQAQKASDLAPEAAKIIAEGNQRVRAIASSNLSLKDLLALASGISFAELAIAQSDGATLIHLVSTGEILASLNGVSSSLINVADFASI
ncbi:hypothetical protein QT971_14665 [Microcoleus sp. herbarium19]|uniref:hypothetical protein n=1 Tax=unclassified Microcoleus TaxID=2642155 RepID=UPI002FCF70B8